MKTDFTKINFKSKPNLMKTKEIFQFMIFILLLFVINSCKNKEEEVLPEPINEWQRHAQYDFYTSIILDNYVLNNKMISPTMSSFSVMEIEDTTEVVTHYLKTNSDKILPFISDILSVGLSSPLSRQDINIFATRHSTASNQRFTSLTNFSETSGALLEDRMGAVGAIVNDEIDPEKYYFLTAFREDNSPIIRLLLLDIKYITMNSEPEGYPSSIEITNSQIIPVENENPLSNGNARTIASHYGRFFISLNGGLKPLIVDKTGNITDLSPQFPDSKFLKVLKLNENTLIACTREISTGIEHIYLSNDEGYNWSKYGALDGHIVGHDVLNGNLMMFTRNRIYYLNISTGKFKQLSSEGLPENNITSIDYFNGNIYISTFGAGMYYKTYEQFLEDIENGELIE